MMKPWPRLSAWLTATTLSCGAGRVWWLGWRVRRDRLPPIYKFTFEQFYGTKAAFPRGATAEFRSGGHEVENVPVILVVEDDQLVQDLVEESLTDGGFEISIVSTGEKAVALLDTSEGKYRALITDINLGEGNLDGWDVARHAREIDPNFPVVYMSGKDADEWASKGVPNSIMLAKPFAPAQLVTAISQLLNASPPIAPTS
jgi:CheY-like chemotaxis protein